MKSLFWCLYTYESASISTQSCIKIHIAKNVLPPVAIHGAAAGGFSKNNRSAAQLGLGDVSLRFYAWAPELPGIGAPRVVETTSKITLTIIKNKMYRIGLRNAFDGQHQVDGNEYWNVEPCSRTHEDL